MAYFISSSIYFHLTFVTFSAVLTQLNFFVVYGNHCSSTRPIFRGHSSGQRTGLLYTPYTANIPVPSGPVLATFADDTALLSSSGNYTVAVTYLQNSLTSFYILNVANRRSTFKSANIIFALLIINGTAIPYRSTVRYLCVHLERLTYAIYVRIKRQKLDLRLCNLAGSFTAAQHSPLLKNDFSTLPFYALFACTSPPSGAAPALSVET